MRKLIGLAVLLASGSVYSSTLVTVGTFGTESELHELYSYQDGDPDDPTTNINFTESDVIGLSQFDPSLGTLTGITVAASFAMDVTASLEVFEALDFSAGHSARFIMTNGSETGVGAILRYDSPSEPGSLAQPC